MKTIILVVALVLCYSVGFGEQHFVYSSSDTISKSKIVEYESPCNIVFSDGKEIGILSWKTGELKFEGKADKSAKLFFEFLKRHIDEYIKNKISEEGK